MDRKEVDSCITDIRFWCGDIETRLKELERAIEEDD